MHAGCLTGGVHDYRDREDDERADQRLHRAGDDLLYREQLDRHGGQRPVRDRALPGELHDQREHNRHDPPHEQHGRHQSWHEDGRERDPPAACAAPACAAPAEHDPSADLGHHIGEHEDEKQWLDDRAGERGQAVSPQHPELAGHHRGERLRQGRLRHGRPGDQGRDAGSGLPRGLPRSRPPSRPRGLPCDVGRRCRCSRGTRHSRYSRPVRVRKTVSRLGLS